MSNKYVRVDRQSICMGDDINAPNEKLISVGEKDMLSDIFKKIESYLPQMCNVIWAVDTGKKVIGYIVVDTNKQAQYELCLENQVFCELDIESLHCSYFHQKSFVYVNGENGEIINKYPECETLLDKAKHCMRERFLHELKIKGGSLCIWGEWFGKPYENFNTIETAIWKKNEIILSFKGDETLFINNPMGIVNEDNHLIIKDATRILWTWYSYGLEHAYENLYVRQYTKNADGKIIRAEGKRQDIKDTDGTEFHAEEKNAIYLV